MGPALITNRERRSSAAASNATVPLNEMPPESDP